MSEIYIAICSGFSPGARVLRAAVRKAALEEKDIRMVTVVPALSGLPAAEADVRALAGKKVIAVDGCEGLCGIQVLSMFGVTPTRKLMIEKQFAFSDKAVDVECQKILKLVREARA
jgi:uncharacterized metal-binding protein